MKQTCPNCGSQIEQGNAFCNVCGATFALSSPTLVTCPKCGKRFPKGLKFCDVDGSLLYDPMTESPTIYQAKDENGGSLSRTLLLIYVISYTVIGLIDIIPRYVIPNSDSFTYIMRFIWAMSWLALLLIPLAIKKLPFKIIGFIILTPIVLLNVYYCFYYIF